MKCAIERGEPTPLDYVDVFCDGTAVRQAGELTAPLCTALLDDIITVSNDQVCAAIQLLWSHARILPEPSGALSVAALLKQKPPAGSRPIAIISGGNVDFEQLAWISRHAGIGLKRRRFFRFSIREESGSLIQLLEQALAGINIFDFQYGKLNEEYAWPVLGCEGTEAQFSAMLRQLELLEIETREVTGDADVDFRIIHYESDLFAKPFFCILEFPERPGALFDFMRVVGQRTSICYFNYASTGEQVGRALMGFEFRTASDEHWFKALLDESGLAYHPLPIETVRRIL
jgi:threonine dehydratase